MKFKATKSSELALEGAGGVRVVGTAPGCGTGLPATSKGDEMLQGGQQGCRQGGEVVGCRCGEDWCDLRGSGPTLEQVLPLRGSAKLG